MDEMKIQEKLVQDSYNGKLIEYVELCDIDLDYATLLKVTTVASHYSQLSVLLILLNSVWQISQQMAPASQIFPLLWETTAICEKKVH